MAEAFEDYLRELMSYEGVHVRVDYTEIFSGEKRQSHPVRQHMDDTKFTNSPYLNRLP